MTKSKKKAGKTEEGSSSKPKPDRHESPAREATSTPPVRVSPRTTPARDQSRPQRSRERDKPGTGDPEVVVEDSGGTTSPESVPTPSSTPIDKEKGKVRTPRSRQKPKEVLTHQESPSPRSEANSPRRRSLNRTPVQNEAESVIKVPNNPKKDSKEEKKLSAKLTQENAEHSAEPKSGVKKVSDKPTGSQVDQTKGKSAEGTTSESVDKTNDLVEQNLKEIKSALKQKEKESGITKEVKEKKTRNVRSNGEKETKRRERKKDNVANTKDTQSRVKSAASLKSETSVVSKDILNESGNNMHFIKKKQLAGGSLPDTQNNSGIPVTSLDLTQSVTDQITRAEKLTSLNGDDKSVSSCLSSPVSESFSERELESATRESSSTKQPTISGLSTHGNTNLSSSVNFSQDERSLSRNSDGRCSSGLSSDEARRPSSRVDDLKSVKSSPASSPLIVDRSEPVQIYRDPELMSKNPVRSNVHSMHNSHKSYPNLHTSNPTSSSRPASVGMTSAPLSSSMERPSRTPVIPSVAYPSPILGASLPGASLSSLLPPGLPQLDPATLLLHQQFAMQHQQQQLASLQQQCNPFSMSYPPRGSNLTKAQLEHLWQQKYPTLPVPPHWMLAKQHEELVSNMRLLHEQEHMERERMERERERNLHEREQRERKERERWERERLEKERLDR